MATEKRRGGGERVRKEWEEKCINVCDNVFIVFSRGLQASAASLTRKCLSSLFADSPGGKVLRVRIGGGARKGG